MPYYAIKNQKKCQNCDFCEGYVACSAKHVGYPAECIGCGACFISCPHEAIEMRERSVGKAITIWVDGKSFSVPERISVRHALEFIGFKISKFPEDGALFVPCEVGGCWSCAVEIDGEVKPSCVTGIRDGMKITIALPENYEPRRIVHGWIGHTVGGVGTPWWLKGNRPIEVACFAAGCNLRCRQCQNWMTTYCGKGEALTPQEAALLTTGARMRHVVERMAISGGESTLNRVWLVRYLKALKKHNPDSSARLHVDTNATILTKDYLDELIEAGMTDIGPDLKGLYPETFMRITGIENRELAEKYLRTGWEAVAYIINNYRDKVFIGIGIPYNEKFISLHEIAEMGQRIAQLDPSVQVCALNYRPEFRGMNITRPTSDEMLNVWKVLKDAGLKTVICQTEFGHIGPGKTDAA
ncbi:MAG: radical SAM protein [Nitrospira sp.]|nr:radical SAM protein [Nitrospira sp.]